MNGTVEKITISSTFQQDMNRNTLNSIISNDDYDVTRMHYAARRETYEHFIRIKSKPTNKILF